MVWMGYIIISKIKISKYGIWNFIDNKKYKLGKKLAEYSKEKILFDHTLYKVYLKVDGQYRFWI